MTDKRRLPFGVFIHIDVVLDSIWWDDVYVWLSTHVGQKGVDWYLDKRHTMKWAINVPPMACAFLQFAKEESVTLFVLAHPDLITHRTDGGQS